MRLVQPAKALLSISVAELGMVTLVRLVHPSKILCSKLQRSHRNGGTRVRARDRASQCARGELTSVILVRTGVSEPKVTVGRLVHPLKAPVRERGVRLIVGLQGVRGRGVVSWGRPEW